MAAFESHDIRTAGDAVIFYWKLPVHQSRSSDFEDRESGEEQIDDVAGGEIVLKAATCCGRLLEELGSFAIDIDGIDTKELRIHLGIGAGKVFDVHVGGDKGSRWEHFVAGDAVNQISTVLDLAKPGKGHLLVELRFVALCEWRIVDLKFNIRTHRRTSNVPHSLQIPRQNH